MERRALGLTPGVKKFDQFQQTGDRWDGVNFHKKINFFHIKGVGYLKDKKITALVKEYLMEQIDADNPVQVEKVERYCTLANVYYSLAKKVDSKNILTEIKNGSQQYIKTNPAVSEMAKVNAQMINLSKDMGLSAPPPGVKALTEAGYKESDLI